MFTRKLGLSSINELWSKVKVDPTKPRVPVARDVSARRGRANLVPADNEDRLALEYETRAYGNNGGRS